MNKVFETPLYPYQRSPDQDAATPARHPVIVIGAGPVGLAAAIDLAQNDVPVIVVDENDKVSWGSRAICYAKRPLEILDRLGCGDEFVDKGVVWNLGKVFFGDRNIYAFDLLPEKGHKRPAFINLQQYHFEEYLVQRVLALQAQGKPIEIRGNNRVTHVEQDEKSVLLSIDTPDGPYRIACDWLIACDGATSPVRRAMGLDFVGRVFEDNFLIADVIMQAGFPTERWFWFDPPFNRNQSALLHKQPDNVWRIDLQLGHDIDKDEEKKHENVIPRLKAMLGEDAKFELEWVSIYTFQCRRMEKFRHKRVLFAGDSAHQVSPFGARGANSGVQDTDNLVWKLKLVIEGKAPESLLDSYDHECVMAAEENILNSSRSTDFITPKSDISRNFRNAVLDLSEQFEFARPLVNSGRLSVPCIFDGSPLNSDDHPLLPTRTRPGAPATDAPVADAPVADAPVADAPVADGWLMDILGHGFQLLAINMAVPATMQVEGVAVSTVSLDTAANDPDGFIRERYLGEAEQAVYLVRPDQRIAARWTDFDEKAVASAVRRAIGLPAEDM